MLSEKAAQILGALIHNSKTPLPAKRLAELLEMSERSVGSYLKELSEYCRLHDIELIIKQGTGIYLNPKAGQEDALLQVLQAEKPHYSSEYRMWYIISLLLNNWAPYTIALFADDLYVSKHTVSNDLSAARDWLQQFQIEIVSKPGAGVVLNGQELDIRSALVAVNRHFYACKDREVPAPVQDYRLDPATHCRLRDTYKIKSSGLREYIDLLHRYESKAGVIFTEDSFVMVLEFLLVQKKRTALSCLVALPEAMMQQHSRTLTSCLTGLSALLPEEPAELAYSALLLESADCQYTAPRQAKQYEPEIRELSDRIIRYTSDLTGIRFQEDDQLHDDVLRFLGPSLLRTMLGFQLANPLLTEVKQAYPSVFSACYAAGRFYQQRTGKYPSEDELSHLALLVGGAAHRTRRNVRAVVVSAAGIGAAQLMTMRLQEELPWLQIVAVLPFSGAGQAEDFDPQVIISTSPSFQHSIPTIHVSAKVGDADIRAIRRACNRLQRMNPAERQITLGELMYEDLIYLDQSLGSREKVIGFAAERLIQKGFVDEQFYPNTIEREYIASTALGKGIAIPHSTSGTVMEPAVCMIRLEKSIDWSGEAVDIVFVLALDFVDIKTTSAFFKALYTIISDNQTVESLRRAGSIAEVQAIIAERCEFE